MVMKQEEGKSVPPAETEDAKRRVEYDDLYRRSSQFNIWSFTQEELLRKRQEVNQRGRDLTLKKCEHVKNPVSGEFEKVENIELLTVEEEEKIIAYYARKAVGLSNLFKMPSQVRGTAISYLKRFYLSHSVMEYHPKNIMLTCLFLAAKAENYFIGIKTFAGKINNIAPENILKYEYLVIQSLQFTLMVHHPFRSLYGFYLDIQTVLPKLDKSKIGASFDRTKDLIGESLISDVAFLYTPPQIALACWRKVNKELIDRYLRRKFVSAAKAENMATIKEEEGEEDEAGEDEGSKSVSVAPGEQEHEKQQLTKLTVTLEACAALVDTGYDPSLDESKLIDKKVHYCITPAKTLRRKRDTPATATPETQPEPKKIKLEE